MDVSPSETRPDTAPRHQVRSLGFAPGTVLANRYRIVALLGRGAMGEVYRADDQRVGQPVALKFLPVTLEFDSVARERLVVEVRNARAVSHPNVCRVYDIGEVDDRYVLTMEYIDGEDLASLLRRIGRLPAPKALEIARQLCAGLTAAHNRGVLHRDLKPANVMVDGRGQAHITDFGLAVEAGASSSPADVAGTPAYMAPERFRGTPATVQSDLYALGLILYETYTGTPAFAGVTIEELHRAHNESTPTVPSALVSGIEPAVGRAIMRCLEKDPAKRPVSAAQVAAALPGGDPLTAALAAGETPSPELVAASGKEGTLPRAQAWAWFAGCLTALAALVCLGAGIDPAHRVPFAGGPDALRATARDILQTLGHRETPTDTASWFPFPAPGAAGSRSNLTDHVRFRYRQSATPLRPLNPQGRVFANDPARRVGDALVELDETRQLVSLRVFARPPAPSASTADVDWERLFEQAGLDFAQFRGRDVPPRWEPLVPVDQRTAWEGQDRSTPVRVEGAAYGGQVVFFAAGADPSDADDIDDFSLQLPQLAYLCLLPIIAIVARRNVLTGRADRTGAQRLAVFALCVWTLESILYRHWSFDPLRWTVTMTGRIVLNAFFAWASYLAVEPLARRRMPHMLIAWTRLLDGRWRDPLVGRSVLAGVLGGLGLGAMWVVSKWGEAPLGRFFDVPSFPASVLNSIGWNLNTALGGMAVVFIARRMVRSDRAAWAVTGVVWWAVFFLPLAFPHVSEDRAWWASVMDIASVGVAIAVASRLGLLAFGLCGVVRAASIVTPLTLDWSRWYAWQTVYVMMFVAGLALWGFWNVLGRQSAFSGGVLEE
jgi:hypothetical protein